MNRCLSRILLGAKALPTGSSKNLLQNQSRRHMSKEIPGPHLLTEGGVASMIIPGFIVVIGGGTAYWSYLMWFKEDSPEKK